eukprot:353063-Prorocentrum_lima.AAC.1
MTSSLVGSEMCIRDRIRDVIVQEGVLEGYQPGKSIIADSLTKVLQKETVSYTHLTLPTICSV